MLYEGRNYGGSDVYVLKGATGAADGTSWTDAYTTIGAAITAGLNPGDILHIGVKTLKAGTPPPSIDAEEYAEDVQFPKGILILGYSGYGGSGADLKNTNVRITGNTGVSDDTPIMELCEGSTLANVRLEARAHRTSEYFRFHASTMFANSSIGGISYEDTVDCVKTIGSFVKMKNVGIGLNNIAATKVGIRAQSGLSLEDCSFGGISCDCVMAENKWVSLRNCVARAVPFGKVVVHVAEGMGEQTVKDNAWSGYGQFISFDLPTDAQTCLIKNNENIILEAKPQLYLGEDNVAEQLALVTSAVGGNFKVENVSGDANRLRLFLYDFEGGALKSFYLKNPAGEIITTLLNAGAIVEREEYSP